MDTNDSQILRLNGERRREILCAVAWRGMLYSLGIMPVLGCLVYVFAETAWRFFLNDNLRMGTDNTAFLYLWLAIPAMLFGWVLAVHHVLNTQFSHFKISLVATPRRAPFWQKLLGGQSRRR
jgi:Na+-driven multidrug efflux pump